VTLRAGIPILCIAMLVARAAPRPECASCHKAQAIPQPETSMARALETVAACDILRANPRLTFRQGDYSYEIVRAAEQSKYTVSDGKNAITAPIAWAFGLGAAGQTYVYQLNGKWYESRVSFFKAIKGLDLTMGAQGNTPKTLEEAAGRLMSARDTTECFDCHATNVVRNGKTDVDHLTPGVMCERCHGPSEQHVASVKAGDHKAAGMRRLGQLTTEELSDFCGQCHRTWAQIAANGPHDINNIRFQPYRLTNSKCYDAADPRTRCVACHDPHREPEHAAAFYDAKCNACHSAAKLEPGVSAPNAKTCRVAAKDCVTCHMPKDELPGSHNRFTDHRIRIVRAGDVYPE
jgi:hypothetical protein